MIINQCEKSTAKLKTINHEHTSSLQVPVCKGTLLWQQAAQAAKTIASVPKNGPLHGRRWRRIC